ncbi:MAG: MCP four helix bundle domain-containing protein [Nitrospirota bacterium]
MRVPWTSVLISMLIVASGLLCARTLTQVDQDLRAIYAEYTLAATDLGHVNGELIRYRTSVIRAIQADTQQDYERIADSLPQKRLRIDQAIERFVNASNDASLGRSMDARELTELKALQEKLEAFIVSSQRSIQLLEQRWRTSSQVEAQQLKVDAERNIAKDAADKFIGVTLELDRLVEVVAAIAGEVKKEADSKLRVVTNVLLGTSLALAALTLAVPAGDKNLSAKLNE